ncbi:sigma-54-dependent transcriptional regulator [Aestuariirhabdus litorea]|uniref:Sigma-54-dependent Fis family transcriptional regulator n=1 Tax=Aestuariirhabdus litorea TaxID=2528527 RepID=A0A3P3VKB8_9GAMM|nr:sigma-54 dependent transcriptional regulator [Aestuariirhabdus litorea]RRJ82824.1 sigma-54-dependent Fis family transcriptional regulator [Aestuariirhabdus litorea]RWW92983.1 response regulator [Endozoicomonadaceae bacterium GTF-13]
MVSVCLVEDDPIMGESLKQRFELEGVECDWFESAEEALPSLLKGRYGVLFSDIRLPDMSGESLFDQLLEQGQGVLPTLFMTGHGTVNQAVGLLKRGAADYITKPFDLDELLAKLKQICPELFMVVTEAVPVLGISESMRQIEQQLRRATRFNVPVLITGPSGAGKEHAAQFFRDQLAAGKPMPFVSINCAAVQDSLLEAELFGHEKGAFTGADRLRPGLFEQADGGVLFLDELGEMSMAMQAKLLRSLQTSTIRRVGGREDLPVSVHLVCATNRDLQSKIRDGSFREDLYYRINVVHVDIPPLSERPEDIRWYANRLLAGCPRPDNSAPYQFSAAVEGWLARQPWPGNIRQMKNLIERACINSDSSQLELSLFDRPRLQTEPGDSDLKGYMEQCERERISAELERCAHQINDTAGALGISRKNLWEKMRKYGL